MNKILALATWFGIAATALAQLPTNYHVLTHPALPSRDSLDKLNLVLQWNTRLPLDGTRDSIASFQIVPGASQPQLIVQSRAGEVFLFDAESGDLRWRTQAGHPYWPGYAAAANNHSVYISRRDFLYCLSRDKGFHRFITIDPITKVRSFGFQLDFAPSTGPSVDDNNLYVGMNNRLNAYTVPNFDIIVKAKAGRTENDLLRDKEGSYMPSPLWTYYEPGMQLNYPPVVTSSQVGVVSTDGRFMSFNKFERILRFEYQTYGGIGANMGSFQDMAYIGSRDFTLYALSAKNERLAWRFLSGAPIVHAPYVTEHDVLVAAQRKGMYRLDRLTGREYWRNADADRVLTLNNKYVYALDRLGNMLVLDGLRGTAMARFDMRDWLVPLTNELTDRIYFTNHDGQIVCLRHRDNEEPLQLKLEPPPRAPMAPPLTPKPAMEEK